MKNKAVETIVGIVGLAVIIGIASLIFGLSRDLRVNDATIENGQARFWLSLLGVALIAWFLTTARLGEKLAQSKERNAELKKHIAELEAKLKKRKKSGK